MDYAEKTELIETPEHMQYWIKTILEQNSAIIAQNQFLLQHMAITPRMIVNPVTSQEPVEETA